MRCGSSPNALGRSLPFAAPLPISPLAFPWRPNLEVPESAPEPAPRGRSGPESAPRARKSPASTRIAPARVRALVRGSIGSPETPAMVRANVPMVFVDKNRITGYQGGITHWVHQLVGRPTAVGLPARTARLFLGRRHDYVALRHSNFTSLRTGQIPLFTCRVVASNRYF